MAPARDRLGPAATAAVIAALGFAVGLAGDACHVASGTTRYEWAGVPALWRSAVWFPVAVASAIVLVAWLGERWAGQPARPRGRLDAVAGSAVVLALYALTAVLRGQPATASVVLVGALALAVWAWWDPSPGSLALAALFAVAGPLAEIAVTAVGAASYAPDSDDLWGVAPWLPALYFAAGAVSSRLWAAVARDGA